MVLTTRRGQFFIIGALLIAALITGYVILDIGSIQTPQTQTPRQLFDHALQEFPAAINYITAEAAGASLMQQRLTTYLAFQQHLAATHGTTTQTHALVTIPDGDNMTTVVANFHGQNATDVRITADGETETIAALPDQSSEQATFTDVSDGTAVRLALDTGRSFNQSFRASNNRRTALFYMRMDGPDQTWTATRIY